MDDLKKQLKMVNSMVIESLTNPEVRVEDFYLPLLGLLRIYPILLDRFTNEEISEIMVKSLKDEKSTIRKQQEEVSFELAGEYLKKIIKGTK